MLEFNRHVINEGTTVPAGRSSFTDQRRQPNDFQIEGDKLLTDSKVAEIVYIAKIMVEEKWDAQFTNTVVAALKLEIAKNQSAEQGVVSQLQNEYFALLKINKAQNNLQASSVELVTDTYFLDR